MRTSVNGLDELKRSEGVRQQMYLDSAGLPTIGVGHLLTRDELRSGKVLETVKWREGLSLAQVDELLRRDLELAETAVNTKVKVPLTENRFDVLVSFVFNVGTVAFANSRLLRWLNEGRYDDIPVQLKRWVHSAGRVDPVLEKRREEEIRQWKLG